MFSRRLFLFFFLPISCYLLPTCLFSQGTWVQKASLPGLGRYTAVAFTIGNKGYLGTGKNGKPLDDFWEYAPATNSWMQRANFPGGGCQFAVGFSIGNFGYVGTGSDDIGVLYQDFWRYDPNINSWDQIADFSGSARLTACCFSIGNKAYVGTGTDSSNTVLNDFWEYDPITNSWTQISNFIGPKRSDVDRATFVIGNKAYLGTGHDGMGFYNDCWEYDPLANTWTQKANLPAAGRKGATGFSICNKGFLGLGMGMTSFFNDLWMYDPASNSWSAVSSLPAARRIDQPSFVINNKAYIGTGLSIGMNTFLNDFWEYTPDNLPSVVAEISDNKTICAGSSVSLAASGGENYLWSTSDTTNTITVSPSTTTSYSVLVSTDCISATAYTTITPINSNTASFDYEYDPCKSNCVQFRDQSVNAGDWHWTFGDGDSSSNQNPCWIYPDSSIYTSSLIINANTHCADTFSLSVHYTIHNSASLIYIPNAFSPNGDGENDSLKSYLQDTFCLRKFEITIYDRWGEQVFETTNINDFWDGTFNGKNLDSGVFVYYCQTTTATGRHVIRKGNITLIR